MSLIEIIDFESLGDDRGNLISIENSKSIPFDIKRVYYLFDTGKNIRRGFHAHKELKQIAIALKGSCRFELDNGKDKTEVLLDNPTQGLYINSFLWREMFDFSSDCVLLVLASEHYQESDYIRDYSEFKSYLLKESTENLIKEKK